MRDCFSHFEASLLRGVGSEAVRDCEWPAGHSIGVFLTVDDHARLVGTARGRDDLAGLFRHLASEWERMTVGPDLLDVDGAFFFPEIIPPRGSLGPPGV
jgi:hypothetical protein